MTASRKVSQNPFFVNRAKSKAVHAQTENPRTSWPRGALPDRMVHGVNFAVQADLCLHRFYSPGMTSRIGRGGRKGQTHTATPRLRSFDVPPASPVTVTRADGTQEVQAARSPKATPRPTQRSRRTGPLICAWCGGPIKGALRQSEDPGSRGKPVHADGECDTAPPQRPAKPDPASTLPRSRGGARAPYKSANAQAVRAAEWMKVRCPKCGVRPGAKCVIREGKARNLAHQERVQVVRRAKEKRRLEAQAAADTRRSTGRQPRVKDMYRIPCPTCRAEPGVQCTITGGHSIRYNRMVELFRAGQLSLL